jgi:hypothetical protein
MRQQVFRYRGPGRSYKIDIGKALRYGTEKHGPLAELAAGKSIPHAGTESDMSNRIQITVLNLPAGVHVKLLPKIE